MLSTEWISMRLILKSLFLKLQVPSTVFVTVIKKNSLLPHTDDYLVRCATRRLYKTCWKKKTTCFFVSATKLKVQTTRVNQFDIVLYAFFTQFKYYDFNHITLGNVLFNVEVEILSSLGCLTHCISKFISFISRNPIKISNWRISSRKLGIKTSRTRLWVEQKINYSSLYSYSYQCNT